LADERHEPHATVPKKSERAIVYLMAGVQFVNVLDFMMVNPLGPRLAEDPSIGVSTTQIPIIVGSYTAAASVTGVLASLFLERFDRRKALVVTLLGLAIGTALGGLAQGLTTLIVARVIAGAFGGPATSLAFAIVSDAIPQARRGWAMGIVMGGFSVASVLGVPAGLTMARFGGWRTPFWGVGLLIVIAAFFASRLLPPLRDHLDHKTARAGAVVSLARIVKKPLVILSLVLTASTMMSAFIIIPNIPAFAQFNLGFPPERLDVLYLLGGLVSFVTTRTMGPLVDRYGAPSVSIAGSILLAGIVWLWFVAIETRVPVLVVSTSFFVAMGMRGVAYNTLTSTVAEPHERARFQSVQSAVQHGASAAAAFISAHLLIELPDRRLGHVERIGIVSLVLIAVVPVLMIAVQRAVVRRAREAAASPGRAVTET